MSSKTVFNYSFGILILTTAFCAVHDNIGELGTGSLVFIMMVMYAADTNPED